MNLCGYLMQLSGQSGYLRALFGELPGLLSELRALFGELREELLVWCHEFLEKLPDWRNPQLVEAALRAGEWGNDLLYFRYQPLELVSQR